MKQVSRYIVYCIFLAFLGTIYISAEHSSFYAQNISGFSFHDSAQNAIQTNEVADTSDLKYPVSKIIPDEYKDLAKKYPIDLHNPENFKSDFEYDPLTNTYLIKSKIGDLDVITPYSLTPEEYRKYSLRKSMDTYFSKKREEEALTKGKGKDILDAFDLKFDIGPAEKIFGPGGVRLQAQGDATIKMGLTRTHTGNPTLTSNQRNRTAFDFDSQIRTNVSASVGDKLNFKLDYNTETTFNFDTRELKLSYKGKEDEIVKVLEAGNVSMNTSNSLIRGGAALFGIKTELQFGKLTVGAIFSQQESESRVATSKGREQTLPYEIKADEYDANKHFFLAHYFRDTYDNSLKTLPLISSGIRIGRVEVWITNKRADYNQARNIVAFSDLGEHKHISNTSGFIHPTGSDSIPYNDANDLYSNITNNYPNARSISLVNQTLSPVLNSGQDYEKIENARRLSQLEFNINYDLGYISLNGLELQADEALAVSYEYNYRGISYQVGEFSTDRPDAIQDNLYLKLIKGTAMSPVSPFWDLMMKNVYTIPNTASIQADKFKLDIKFLSDTTGAYLNYIPEGTIANQILLRVMNLDRLDTRGEPYPDGFFDFQEGYTVVAQLGRIIFPVIEPFGSHLRKKINNNAIADKYVFQELYDSTLTIAKQLAEKNKFIMQGEYKSSGGSNIDLGGMNIAKGSVRVSANGKTLVENVDYTVDYTSGKVEVTNPIYADAKIDIDSENQSNFGMQRKTMMGLNMNYAINPKFNVGATIMNLSEMPLTMKVNLGDESINNTLYGFNTNFATQSLWLTNMIDKLPFVDATAPSQISFSGEFAQLIPGHYKSKYGGNYSYIDDFEKAKTTIDMRSPFAWSLSSTPSGNFEEAKLSNDPKYGNNRALLAWYYIDGLFSRSTSLTPSHIRNDKDQLSNHYVREVRETELFPNKELGNTEQSTLPVLNLAYYPKERGPYNLDAIDVNEDGTLSKPEGRWGGITRRIETGQTDFEATNIEYIEFWLLDPFLYEPNSKGGSLYFNLGEISEDVLKDEKKFFENGIPVNDEPNATDTTVWGRVPKKQSLTYAFDANAGSREKQDVGMNGLSSREEQTFPTYRNFLNQLQTHLDPQTWLAMQTDLFSPINNPSGDVYHYFRGADYDQQEASILHRYKKYNGLEGNSAEATDSKYSTSAKLTPDVEDINQDNTLSENEKYFEYKISLKPSDLVVGKNFIADKRETSPLLKNGKQEKVTWYQFKIPIKGYQKTIGNIRDFKTIRFARMFLTDFVDSTVLRFGTLELVKGEWRQYSQDLSNPNLPPSGNTSVILSTVNIEENGDRPPVNYVLPPGVNRILDPSQPQLRQENEQSLSLKITDIAPGDARAIYKNTGLDTRQYRRMQMFSHAERFQTDVTENLKDGELSIFLRLGSDYKNNYYEYEIPLKLTPFGTYSDGSASDREIVWPRGNLFDFPFEILTNLKLARNKEKRKANSSVTYFTPFSDIDPNNPMNKITIVGNPSISEVKVIMVGVRNNSRQTKSAEVWINEMRLTDFNEDGGWAANANLSVGLSDLGTLNFTGKKETAGFGALDQGLMERNIDDRQQYNISATVEVGRMLPEKAKISMPFHYSYTEDIISSKYNPLDQDILLKQALGAVETEVEKDSIKNFSQDKVSTRNFGFNNVRIDVKSKNPMPYDPANFSLGYISTVNNKQNATTSYERNSNTRASMSYSYSPFVKPIEPFKNIKSQSGALKFFKDLGFNYLPGNINITSDITRTYYELQLRDLSNSGINAIPVSFREDFFWNRTGSLQWNLTKNLTFSLNTGTNARIDAPHVQVNKRYNQDDYSRWKDTVWQSIRGLGTPSDYQQTFNATYTVPLNLIPVLNYINASIGYNATYDWEKGAIIQSDKNYEMGNMIRNMRSYGLDNLNIDFKGLYNKSQFLKDVEKKFAPKRTNTMQATNTVKKPNSLEKEKKGNNQLPKDSITTRKVPKVETKKFEKQIHLNMDSSTVVDHLLNTKRLRVTARNENGKLYDLKFKKINNNSIRVDNKDSADIKLAISQLPPLDESTWYKVAQVAARGLMMVRSAGFSYTLTDESGIPNFLPTIGDFFGQGSTPFGNAPGLDFAFGASDETYLEKADSRGWLIKNPDFTTPATFSNTETFNAKASLEPISGLRINFDASRIQTSRSEILFSTSDAPRKYNGNFNMTTIAIMSAFGKNDPSNGYRSNTFEQFRNNRQVIFNRLQQEYSKVENNYPTTGFFQDKPYAGNPFDPNQGNMTPNSTDVLIPAFLAAYTNKDAGKIGLSAFPSLLQLLPNWTINYDGFMQLDIFRKNFKTFLISHGYNCRYLVGSYNSYPNWVSTSSANGLGYIQSLTKNPIPSSPYEIVGVSLIEAFNPLIGINGMLRNNISLKLEMTKIRNINLNVSSYQIVETAANTFVVGLGYVLTEFNKVLKMKASGGKNFSNDLKITGDVNIQKSNDLIRKIDTGITEATRGDSQTTIKLTADYSLSKALNIQAFYDRQVSKPLVSSTSYPMSRSSFGVSIKISLAR